MKTFTAIYTSPLGPIVIESDGQAITSLRFSNEQVHADSTGQGEEILKEAATALPIIAETAFVHHTFRGWIIYKAVTP